MDRIFVEHENLKENPDESKTAPNNTPTHSIIAGPQAYFPFISTPSCLENSDSNVFPVNPNVLDLIQNAQNLSNPDDFAQFLRDLTKTPKGPPKLLQKDDENVKKLNLDYDMSIN